MTQITRRNSQDFSHWLALILARFYSCHFLVFKIKMAAEAKLLRNIGNPSAISFLINNSFDEHEVVM